jgi:hypothetical protein
MIENVVCFLSPPLAGVVAKNEFGLRFASKKTVGLRFWDLITWPSKKFFISNQDNFIFLVKF